jgi:hypothetical protein
MFGTNADSNQPGRNATQSRENDLFDFATLKKAVQADPVARPRRNRAPGNRELNRAIRELSALIRPGLAAISVV